MHHLLVVWCIQSQRYEEYVSSMGIIVVLCVKMMLYVFHGTKKEFKSKETFLLSNLKNALSHLPQGLPLHRQQSY